MWAIPTGTSSVLKKKNQVKSPSPESRVPETGSDSPIGSDRESGRDIHNVLTELEGFVNNLGSRKDHLITLVEYNNDYCLFNKEEPPTKENPDISIPKFPPSLASFNLEPPNLKTSKFYKRRR